MNIAACNAILLRMRMNIEQAGAIGVREGAEIIKTEAQAWIGHQHDKWSPLADKTELEKEKEGDEVPDPLLRTGKLRDSIQVKALGLEAIIGTDDELGPIHEFGTEHVPPRPFLSSALMSKGNEAVAIIEENIAKAIHKIR